MIKRLIVVILSLMATLFCACGVNNGKTPGGGDNGGEQTPSKEQITSFDNSGNLYTDRIGETYWGAKYLPGEYEGDSVSKACDLIERLGVKVIKLACSDPASQYPLDDFSGLTFASSVDILKHSIFANAFKRNFKTFFIVAKERKSIKWDDGVLETEGAYVESEFYEMTKHLLNTYKNSGKTFILQNWETDNAVGQNREKAEMRYYADYYNYRQKGINMARNEFVMSEFNNVYVFGAIEVNILTTKRFLRAVDEIVPYTHCDLYTYSSYESKDSSVVANAEEVKQRVVTLMNLYRSKLPLYDDYPADQPRYFGDKRLAITEFGYGDFNDGYLGERTKYVVEGHLKAGDILNLQYLVHWQIACNEAIGVNKATINSLKGQKLRNYKFLPGDLNGFFLIRPDGVKTYTYNYLFEVLKSNSLDVDAFKPKAWKKTSKLF